MKNLWLKSLALSLGLLAPTAYADDGMRQPAASGTQPSVVIAATPKPTMSAGVTLDRPIPIGTSPAAQTAALVDPQVRPTAYDSQDAAMPAYRGQSPDPLSARPLPVGAPPAGPNAALSSWRKYGEAEATPELAPPPAKVNATPTQVPGEGDSLWSRFTHLGGADDCDGCAGSGCAAGSDCGAACCGDHCLNAGQNWYVSAEYLMWWFKGQSLPPLVTSGSLGDPIPGALGAAGTNILFGGGNMESGPHSGARFTAGYWLTDDHSIGLEGGYFFLGSRDRAFTASSGGTPILTRPFIDAATGTETTELVAGPNVLSGTVSVQTRSSLWGAEANLKSTLCCGCNYNFNILAGFKTLGLDEDLSIHESLTVLQAPGGTFDILDQFQTRNRFYGGQVGAEWEGRRGRWSLDVKAKMALGVTQEIVDIRGSTVINDPVNGTRTFNGGLLAQPSNIGHYSRDRVAYVPDVGLTVGYNLTDHLRCFAGYNFMYWSNVARPGAQIDRTINQNQIPPAVAGGPARPAFNFTGSDFWAQGATVGLEYKW